MAGADVYVFLAQYSSVEDARADFRVLADLHGSGAIGTFDAAVVTRDARGGLRIEEGDRPLRHASWKGAAVGAVVGILFPSILVAGAAGAAAGGVAGHFRRGLSDLDVGDLGRILDAGEAGLVVVTDAGVAPVLEQNLTRARATVEKGLRAEPELVDALDRS